MIRYIQELVNRAYRAALQHTGNDDELAVVDGRVPTDMTNLVAAEV
jgi:hypothetical protein